MSSGAHTGGSPPRPDFLARFLSAVPLLVVYFGLAALYAWQASRRPVPTIFTDELELTQLARSIAETGEPARRGEPYGLASLVAYALAPVWWRVRSQFSDEVDSEAERASYHRMWSWWYWRGFFSFRRSGKYRTEWTAPTLAE